ncbi:type-F conjugative transfer system pilin assembly protein TrbC [Hydromonas duriensis]|uniref:Conjugal transfer pilus assembly protein TrbC n=1 Tax=Hydromonas duriensis TaxID=1527608 RepID=A0A4R6Y598_9BURK|nr:type-F conjugative transfer system pilin assembly protein TrbC [Hydromonas duriensis]TDR30294.1 conjugal transfer pilus assembly protein TrbC [Hydromonas duriensis]
MNLINSNKLKKAVLLTSIIACVAVAAQPNLNDVNLKTGQERAQSILQQVAPKAPTIDEPSIKVDVSDVQSRVPTLPEQQGQVAASPELIDPLAVAARAKRTYAEDIDPTMLEGTNVLVFVSFSMPEASLKRIATEVAKVHGTMVLRGFVGDSLKQTVDALNPLTNLGAQVQIHPELFKAFNVTQVPTYVLVKPGSSLEGCGDLNSSCQNHLTGMGDASLRSVLERMSRTPNNPLTASAQAVLSKLEAIE